MKQVAEKSRIECNRCGEEFEYEWRGDHATCQRIEIINATHLPVEFTGRYCLTVCPDCYLSFEKWWHDTDGKSS